MEQLHAWTGKPVAVDGDGGVVGRQGTAEHANAAVVVVMHRGPMQRDRARGGHEHPPARVAGHLGVGQHHPGLVADHPVLVVVVVDADARQIDERAVGNGQRGLARAGMGDERGGADAPHGHGRRLVEHDVFGVRIAGNEEDDPLVARVVAGHGVLQAAKGGRLGAGPRAAARPVDVHDLLGRKTRALQRVFGRQVARSGLALVVRRARHAHSGGAIADRRERSAHGAGGVVAGNA